MSNLSIVHNNSFNNLTNSNIVNNEELIKLNVLFDYLFYDQTKYFASFTRFFECFQFIISSNYIKFKEEDLFDIFKEIIGENKKYLEIPRFLNKYFEFKKNPKSISKNLQNFFTFIINNLIKISGNDFAGSKVNDQIFTTKNSKNYSHISSLSLLTTENKFTNTIISGMIITYDDIYQNNLFIQNNNETYYKSLTFNLEYDNELKTFDGISHIFGNFSNKINFLGFKTKSGIFETIGSEFLGEPFIFGYYGKELNYIDIIISKGRGLVYFKPYFKETNSTNLYIDKISKEIYNKKKFPETKLFEENLFNENNKITDEIIKLNLIKDFKNFYFFNNNNNNLNHKIKRQKRFSHSNRSTSMSSNNLNTLISLNEKNEKENILNEADEFYEKIFKNNNFNDINNNNNKNDGIYEIINRKKKKWNSPSIKNISIENLIKIKYNYSKIIETLKNIIEHEINNENLKFQYDKNFDFYDEYLMKYNILEPYEIEQKNFLSYKDLKNIQNDFENFLNEKKIFNNNNNNNDLYYLNNNNRENVYSTKQIHRKWVVLAKLLIQKNVTCVLIAITSLLKAIKIIENVEENYFDHTVSIENKIKIFKYLVNYQWFLNNHFIYNNNNINNNNNNKYLKNKIEENPFDNNNNNINYNNSIIINNNISNIYSDFDDDDLEDNLSSIENNNNNTNLININSKLSTIKELIKSNPKNYKKLSLLYNKYYRLQQKIINKLNNQQEKQLVNKYNLTTIKKNILLNNEKKINQKKNILIMTTGDINTSSVSDIDFQNEKNKIYRKQAIPLSETEDFNDFLFYPNEYNLTGINRNDYNNNNFISTNKIFSNFNIKWSKLDLILYTNNYQILPNLNEFNINNNIEINSGIYKNFYFISAIFSLLKYPSLIYNLFPFIKKSINNLYAVSLRIEGIWKLILLDDYFPCIENKEGLKFFAFSSLNETNIWLILLEKAYAKICKNYNNILEGNVTEIFDVILDSPTKKFNIYENNIQIILKHMLNALKEKFIIIIKSSRFNNNLKEIGIMPNQNYNVIDIKLVNIGALQEYLILLKNPFGNLKYSGHWGKFSNKWIPSLKNLIPKNEDEFYISIEELYLYFNVLYINEIHCLENNNNNEYFVNTIHYNKKECESPNVASFNLYQNTKINIQFHQKNPKFNNFNQNNYEIIKNVPAFILITDEKFNYIDSLTSNENFFNFDIELKPGKYFIYSDINYRYVFSNDNLHGYTLSTYSNDKFDFLKEMSFKNYNFDKENFTHLIQCKSYDLLKHAIIDYAKRNLIGIKNDLGLMIYSNSNKNKNNNINNKFPFLFCYYDNSKGVYDKEIETFPIKKNNDSVRDYAFYLDNEKLNYNNNNNNIYSCKKYIKEKEDDLICILKLNENFNFYIDYSISCKISDNELINYIISNGIVEELNDDGMIVQYMIEYNNGFVVLIENKYEEDDLKMKFMMKGLTCYEPLIKKGDIYYFTLKRKDIKIFKLKVMDKNVYGVVSFQFQFA